MKRRSKKETTAAPAGSSGEVERLERLLREERAKGEKREEELLLALLALLDGFLRLERAMAGEELGPEGQKVRDRFSLVRRRLERQLEREGIERIDASGEFHGDLHEVVEVREVEGIAPGRIVEIEQEGYLLRGKRLRAARVIVAH